MYRVPHSVLEKLRCSICEGYLSMKPSMVRPDEQQVCGRCFRILPAEEREKCVRQVGLEALAEVLIFPCRYVANGCSFTYNWCDEKDHEVQCPYRYETYRNSQNFYTNVLDRKEVNCHNEDVSVRVSYELKEGHSNCLAYTVRLRGNSDSNSSLVLKSPNPSVEQEVEILVKGVLSLKQSLEPIHTSVEVKEAGIGDEAHVYESVQNLRQPHCSNCKVAVSPCDKHTCLFGHVSCENCKGNVCVVCAKIMEKESKGFCRNYNKGCKTALSTEALNVHQDDCTFNDFKCPLEPCNYIDLLPRLEAHLKHDHLDKIYIKNEVARTFFNRDDAFVVVWNGNIFKCVYFYYKTFVEFFVTYIGPSREALGYTYEVAVPVNGSILRKRSRCAHWNNLMLEKGVSFEKKDLIAENEKRLKFDIKLRIMHRQN